MPDNGVMHPMVKCSTPNHVMEEESIEEAKVDSAEGDRVSRPENATPTNGKKIGTILWSSVEGGVILPDRAVARTRSNAGIVGNSTTTMWSAERSNESRLRPVDNS